MSPSIRIELSEAVELHYHVLAHLDLGRDSASIHNPLLRPKPWTSRLLAAYREAPGRLVLQFEPLFATTVDGLIRGLEQALLRRPVDEADVALRIEMARALAAERAGLGFSPQVRGAEVQPLLDSLPGALEPLRVALWGPSGKEPPPLRLVHCPPLGRHARAVFAEGTRVVAASLTEPFDQVVCQVFHEETHVLSDPGVRATRGRDTRAGSPGYSVHMELERAAVTLGQSVLAEVAPSLLPAWLRWRRRFRMD